jgi:hypothetical protein
MMIRTVNRIDPDWPLVRVRPGCFLTRHGRGFKAGDVLKVNPRDATLLAKRGTVEAVD